MSTRGAYGFIKNQKMKVSYNHWDSYLEGLGETMVSFIQGTSKKELNDIYDKIKLVNQDDIPNFSQRKKLTKLFKKFGLSLYDDYKHFGSGKKDWYYFLNPTQGKPEYFKKGLNYMTDDQNFLNDTLFCEYAYLIDLDNDKFLIKKDDKTVEYPLDNIPKDWVEEASLKLENRCKDKFMDIIFNKNHEEQRNFLNELGITEVEVAESNGFNYYENENMYNDILDKYDEKEFEQLLDNYMEKNKNDKEEEYE